MLNKCLLFFWISCLACSVAVSAPVERYKFRTMSPAGGFYYDGIKAIEQDKDGFIWVMMDYELYRFDGYQYKKYYSYFASMNHTVRWIFRDMVSDRRGDLYVSTNNGLYRYTRLTNRFEKVCNPVENVKIDGNDCVWAQVGGKWGMLDLESQSLLMPVAEDGKEMPVQSRTAFCRHNEDVYTFSNRKIYRFNSTKHCFTHCFTLPGSGAGIGFACARSGELWIYVNSEGLYKIDLATFEVEERIKSFDELTGKLLRAFYIDKHGLIWLGTNEGLLIFNPSDGKVTRYVHDDSNPYGLPNNSIWTICEDRQSNVWIGAYSGILSHVNVDENTFYKTFSPQNSALTYSPVSSFAEDENNLWIGTEGGGVNRMSKADGMVTAFGANREKELGNVKSLMISGGQKLWISTYREGLVSYDLRSQQLHKYRHRQKDTVSLLSDNIRRTIQEGDSGLWVAYQYPMPKISYFSEKSGTFTHFTLDSIGNYAYLFDIMRQNRHTLWALSNEALYKLDIRTQKVEKITPADSVYLGLFTFCQDDAGNLWIGTIGNGLVKFDTTTSEFISMYTVLQKNHYSIYSICYDNGSVWMGTDDGLFCYDTKSNRLVEFDKREGMQGQVYYPLAVMKGENGLLYFGGTEGFTVVDSKRISYNTYKPKAMISDFYINHEAVHPDRIKEGKTGITIVLNHDQSNFGFSFSSDNYHIPERNRFRYRLKGYNNSWIVADVSQRRVMFSKVPAGTYCFEICAGNNDGVWNEVPTVIKVIRKPAPWFSWWAWGLYALAVGVSLYFICHHYVEKKRWKMLMYREHLEKEKQEQIHEAQLRFFTNISHDFRTPLSLILVALDKLRCEGIKEYYYRILNGNVQRLLNLVNELMDFRTVENGKMKLALSPVDVNSFIEEIVQDFTDYAAQRHVGFRWNLDETLPTDIFVDKNILEKIVMNLLTNAFKYTHEGGNVVLETAFEKEFQSPYKNKYVVGRCSENAFSFIVRDTGVGISEESIESVFERFYKVNTVNFDSHLGTGIGLALVKSLVLLHKGSISIYSERGKGTDMVVCLPMDKVIFAPMDFAESIDESASEETAPGAEVDSAIDDAGDMTEMLLPSNLKKILLVEDNTDLRKLIAESLSDEFHVIQAADGLEALKQMEDLEFDLVLSDIMMPHKDGVSLCRDIKNNLETSHIPVALLTAKVGVESKIEGADSGADFYFEKPIDLTYLKLSIRNLFRSRQQLKEHYAKNYYADSEELSTNEQDGKFLKHLVDFIDANMENSGLDVDSISKEMMMSRSKLYSKMKGLTGKSMVEFVLNCRMRKAARLILEEDVTMREVMMRVGIESQAYFTNSFKKVFGETPTSFAAKHKK